MPKVLRTIALVVLAGMAASSVVYLQYRFDAGDRKSALRIVDEYRAAATHRSITDVLRARHPGAAGLGFSATTESSCMQHIRVRAVVQELVAGGGHTYAYEFLVDINRVRIGPGNELGKEAIAGLDAATVTPAGGAASAPRAPAASP